MKRYNAVAIATLFLFGCGSSDVGKKAAPAPSSPAPAAPPPSKGWTPAEVTGLKSTCVQNGTYLFPEFQKSQFETYCGCLVDTIASRWTYQDFLSKKNQYLTILESDGSDEGCINKAGFYGGSASRLVR